MRMRSSVWVSGSFFNPVFGFLVGAIRFGNHMGGGALEQFDLAGHLGHFRHKLNGAGAGAHHGYGFAGEIFIVIPAGAVEVWP